MASLQLLLFHVFLILFLRLSSAADAATKTSIVFATLGRSRYTFDIFSLPFPTTTAAADRQSEVKLTDGQSVNYNGFFPGDPSSLLHLLPSPPPRHRDQIGAVVYVTERNGSSNIYLDLYPSPNGAPGLPILTRLHLPLVGDEDVRGARIDMKDRPSISGDHLVYVSTKEDSGAPRKSWAAVYATHLVSGSTKRLTPVGIADFSPAVSPSGEWTAVASSGERGWTGEVQELKTDIYVFRTKDGSERRKVVDHGGWPCWVDEKTLYFHRQSEDGWWSVYRARIGRGQTSVDRLSPPGLHAFTPAAAGRSFVVVATRRPTSEYRHIEVLDVERKVFVELTRNVSPDHHHYNPFVSSDLTQIGYHRCRGSDSSDEGGSEDGPLLLENLQNPTRDVNLFRIDGSYPSFSPDGSRIAYVRFPGLFVVNSNGSGKQQVFSGNAFATAWDWKRKGVIYTSHGPTFAAESIEVDIISITLPDEDKDDDGVSVPPSIKRLTDGGKNNAFPSPSPDGQSVVFRSGRSGHKNLYIMDAVEGEKKSIRRLTEGPWIDTMCNWSPNGEWIAFASDRHNPGGGSFAIYFIHPNGTGLKRVVQSGDSGRTNHPFFSPDSKSFVFTTDYAAVSAEPIASSHHYQPYGDIFIAHVDGSNIQRLTHNAYEDGTPAWGSANMNPTGVPESLKANELCMFSDCHWLGDRIQNERTSLGCGHA